MNIYTVPFIDSACGPLNSRTENKSASVAMFAEAVFSCLAGRHHCQMAADQVVVVLTLAQLPKPQWH